MPQPSYNVCPGSGGRKPCGFGLEARRELTACASENAFPTVNLR